MLERLIWTFGAAWLVGVTGVIVARALDAPSGSPAGAMSASFWLVGGIGFVALGSAAMGLDAGARALERVREGRRR